MKLKKLSNDALIKELNLLRDTIFEEDISKLAREDIEIKNLLENYKKTKTLWAGADVVINKSMTKNLKKWVGEQPLVISLQDSFPERRVVITKHALELSWLFIQLKRLYRLRIDYISKYDFYGELAEKAIEIINETNDECSYQELLYEVLRVSKIYI